MLDRLLLSLLLATRDARASFTKVVFGYLIMRPVEDPSYRDLAAAARYKLITARMLSPPIPIF